MCRYDSGRFILSANLPLYKRFFRHPVIPPFFLQPVFWPAAPFYPVDADIAQILRKVAPNTRRVR
jgi:hypothetical protein